MKNKNLFLFFTSFILVILSCIFIYYSVTTNYMSTFNSGFLKHLGKKLGSVSEICFFLVIALFILRLIIKILNKKGMFDINKEVISLRKILLYFNKILQKSHVFIAVVATAIVFIHGYIFLYLGFEGSLGYILGVIAILDLILLLFSGYFRIFNKGIYIHKFLGVLFIILMLAHIVLV